MDQLNSILGNPELLHTGTRFHTIERKECQHIQQGRFRRGPLYSRSLSSGYLDAELPARVLKPGPEVFGEASIHIYFVGGNARSLVGHRLMEDDMSLGEQRFSAVAGAEDTGVEIDGTTFRQHLAGIVAGDADHGPALSEVGNGSVLIGNG